MRPLMLKYGGACRACGASLEVGAESVYERRIGIFCPGCAPTDPEAIRALRQEAKDAKADRLEGWAAKRREKAGAVLQSHKPMTEDWAFITQPGHIPLRARIIKQEDACYASLRKAREMEAKAGRLRRCVRVKGDAEENRNQVREFVRARIEVGMEVETWIYGRGVVEKINRKTARIGKTGTSGTYRTTIDLSFISIPGRKDETT